jgi:integrase
MGTIGEFLETYEKESTRYGYASALYLFFDAIYRLRLRERAAKDGKPIKRVTPELREQYEIYARQYLSESRDHAQDIVTFSKAGNGQTKSIKSAQSTIIEWMDFHGITIEHRERKIIKTKTPKRYKISKSVSLTLERIRTILHHADARMKGVIYVLLASGLRIGEVVSIQLGDFEEIEGGIGKLFIRDSKTGREIMALITPEATRAVKEWLKIRTKYIHEKCVAEHLRMDDGHLFPFCRAAVELTFRNILQRAGFVNPDGSMQHHIHQFRAYHSSQLKLRVHPEIVEYLIGGHSGSIAAVYRKYTFEQVLEAYRDGMDALYVEVDPVIKKKYDEQVGEIKNLRTSQEHQGENMRTILRTLDEYQSQLTRLRREKDELVYRMNLVEKRVDNLVAGNSKGK